MGSHSLCCPWGPGTPARMAGWFEGCCSSRMGTAGGRAQLRVSPGHPSGLRWPSTVGKHFGAGASKSSPAVSGDPKGTGAPGTALHHVPELRQQPAGPQQLCRSCASAAGMCLVLAVEPCQCPATGGHGEVLAWPVGSPHQLCHPWCRGPWALTVCAADAGAGSERFLGPVCQVPGEAGMKGSCGPSSPLQRRAHTFKASRAP